MPTDPANDSESNDSMDQSAPKPYVPPHSNLDHGKVDHGNDTEPASTQSGPNQSLASPSFIGFVATQFFGAFNDNLFKQLLMLLSLPVVAAAGAETAGGAGEGGDMQGVATIVFGLPFVVFGGFAGFLADKFSKRRIIIASKVAEIVVMGLGVIAFFAAPMIGFVGLWVVLFLMGLQSTFFGPGKYGILPEMISRKKLPKANGLVLMTTFIAIIIGTAVAGPVKEHFVAADVPRFDAAQQLWVGSLVCVGIAVIGTICSLLIAKVAPAEPDAKLKAGGFFVPKEMITLLRRDKPLMLALLASCAFWLVAGLTLQAVNSLGRVQLELNDTKTSLMVSLISIGIAAGGAAAGWLTRRTSSQTVIRIGSWGVILWAFVLSVTIPGKGHLLGFAGSIPVLMLLGASAAFFAIPVQVFLQDRPPENLKGRMIAVMNQANFLAIVLAGAVYIGLNALIESTGTPNSWVFAAMAILFLPVAILYRIDETQQAA